MKNKPLSIYRLETLTDLLSEKPAVKQAFHHRFYPSSPPDNTAIKTSLNNAAVFLEALLFLKEKNLPHIAFQAGLSIEMGSLGILDFYLISCRNVQQAILAILKYFPLISSNIASRLDTDIIPANNHSNKNVQDCFKLRLNHFDISDRTEQLEIEFVAGLLINLIKRITHQNSDIYLNLPYHSLASSSYQILIKNNIEVKLKVGQFELLCTNFKLSQPLSFANEMTLKVLSPELEQQLKNLQTHDTIITRVLNLFTKAERLQLTQTQVAGHLNMSESSLKRKLSENHTNFTDLINSFKKEKALQLLSAGNLPYEDIAIKAGYSDRASFERAFKKWIGMTPSQFRHLSSFSQISSKPISMEDIHRIPPSPKVCQQVISLTQTDDFQISTLANLINTDPVLTGKLIGVANSAFYGGQNVSNLEQAIIRVLGISTVQNLTITMMYCQQLKTTERSVFDLKGFWVESLATAEASKYFADSPRLKNLISPSELYLASLLHQIGLLALAYLRPEATQHYLHKLKTINEIDEVNFSQFENKIFGLSLAEMGSLVLTHWGLPQVVCQTVGQLELENACIASQIIVLLSKMIKLLQLGAEDCIPDRLTKQLLEISGYSKNQLDNQMTKITSKLPEVNELAQTLAI
ncbi:MAG TPA: HDOD domain-containing protein [Aeromonadales bacterium]|nr:HDOD domain-containing protein [Aeromonadales bacterium]